MTNKKHKINLAVTLFFATAASICLFAAIGNNNKTIKNVNSTAYSVMEELLMPIIRIQLNKLQQVKPH